MPKGYGFGKQDRLRKPSEFKTVLSTGRRITTPHFVFYIHRKENKGRRLGISISRRVGGAVVRNRLRRLIREVFRLNKHDLPDGVDLVVIVRDAEGIRTRDEVSEEFARVLGSFVGENDD